MASTPLQSPLRRSVGGVSRDQEGPLGCQYFVLSPRKSTESLRRNSTSEQDENRDPSSTTACFTRTPRTGSSSQTYLGKGRSPSGALEKRGKVITRQALSPNGAEQQCLRPSTPMKERSVGAQTPFRDCSPLSSRTFEEAVGSEFSIGSRAAGVEMSLNSVSSRLSQLSRRTSTKKILSTDELNTAEVERKRQEVKDLMRRNERTKQVALSNPVSIQLAGKFCGRTVERPLTQVKEFSLSAPPTARRSSSTTSARDGPASVAAPMADEASSSRRHLTREPSPVRSARSESCRRLATPRAPDSTTGARPERRTPLRGSAREATSAWTNSVGNVSPRRPTPERSRRAEQPGLAAPGVASASRGTRVPDARSSKDTKTFVDDKSTARCRQHLEKVRAPGKVARRACDGASSSTSKFLSPAASKSISGGAISKARQTCDKSKQAVEPESKRDRSAEIRSIPSQALAASSVGDAVALYELVPPKASISTAAQVGEVKNGEICILLKEDERGHFHVQCGDLVGWAAAEHFCNRKYRLLLNLMLSQEFEDVYRKTLEAIGNLGCSTVLRAFREGRTYAHLTLNYDFEVDGEQLRELIAVLQTFAATNERVPLRMKGANAFGASVIFLDVDREHEDYSRAMKLHVDLLETLQCLGFTKSEKDEKDIHWHATVAYKDFAKDKKDEILECVRDTATPVDCYFDNVTIMAKVGPSQAYAGTAKAAMSFPLSKARGAISKARQTCDTPKQAVEPESKRDRSAEIRSIPSQALAASSVGDAVALYELVPPKASISTAAQVGEVKNGEICILLKEDERGHFHVQCGDLVGWAAAEHFCNRKYRLLLNLMLSQEFEDVYRKTLEAIGNLGCSTVLRAFREGRTYAHLTLNYDFEVDGEQLRELIAVLQTFAATNERVPLRMKGADAFGASVIFLDVDREHEDYSRAMKLHVDLLETLQCLGFTKSEKDEKDIHWHATVAYKDFAKDKKDEILECVRDTAAPVDCYFDNVTIMAKVGPSQAYAGTAKAAMSFPLRTK